MNNLIITNMTHVTNMKLATINSLVIIDMTHGTPMNEHIIQFTHNRYDICHSMSTRTILIFSQIRQATWPSSHITLC